MHIFFDTVWKLHIGEIPEKPRLQPHYLGTTYGGHRFKILTDEYNEAIADIKQNAITVGNPILCPQNMSAVEPGKFYEWIGGYDIVGMGTVAILTLPEEKKNTMENMTKEQAAIKWLLDTLRPFENMEALGPLECFKIREIESLIRETTSSGSVAAPKEEPFDKHKFFDKVSAINAKKDTTIESLQSENTALREALKELLPVAENELHQSTCVGYSYIKLKAIIEKARKLLSK